MNLLAILVFAGLLLAAVAVGALIAISGARWGDRRGGLGSDDEWVREFLYGPPPRFPMNGHHPRDDEEASR